MSMFDKFDNIPEGYVPNNIDPVFLNERLTMGVELPATVENIKGTIVAYTWNKGDTLSFSYSVNPTIKVEQDAIIHRGHKDKPTHKVGKLGQRAYNIYDIVSWECIAVKDNKATWQQDKVFTYPDNGPREIKIYKIKNINKKIIELNILNFRREVLNTLIYEGKSVIDVKINKELSNTLAPDLYYFVFNAISRKSSCIISEMAILVKG